MAEIYQYGDLSSATVFRIAELLPGRTEDPIKCVLHPAGWLDARSYEAISYAWGDPNAKAPVIVHDKVLEITANLHTALIHLRYPDRSRLIWVDAICINQGHIPERGAQVKQMRRIYENASNVLVWLGADSEAGYASLAIDAVRRISDFLCEKLRITFDDLRNEEQIYHEVIFKHQRAIPRPSECNFMTSDMWKSLLWLYKLPYFTRLWAIQEITANKHRLAHCGHAIVDWIAVEVVAGYIILDTSFSSTLDFSSAFCWWASTAPAELRQAKNWLHMLYLASNFIATDPRDVVYGLRGMIHCEEGGELLDPDYSKTTLDVYRDSVEAALINYKSTNALLYVSGVEDPSWVPLWNRPMLFRNPFRFGRPVPWQPAGESHPVWSIDKKESILSLSGYNVGLIDFAEPYSELYFGHAMAKPENGKMELNESWQRILEMMAKSCSAHPISNKLLTAAAVAFSFGLDSTCNPGNERRLFHNFVAYLRNVLHGETFQKYVSEETSRDCEDGDGDAFGKPVWDFEYPPASVFITKNQLIGCAIASSRSGDIVFTPLGSVYPLVLRPTDGRNTIRGFCFVHGIMQGEKRADSEVSIVQIR